VIEPKTGRTCAEAAMLSEFEWGDLFSNLPAILCITFIFGGWVFVAVAKAFTESWRRVREAEQMAALKQSMVDKGMSAADIERVLKAGGPTA
jgi:hypothetical protein